MKKIRKPARYVNVCSTSHFNYATTSWEINRKMLFLTYNHGEFTHVTTNHKGTVIAAICWTPTEGHAPTNFFLTMSEHSQHKRLFYREDTGATEAGWPHRRPQAGARPTPAPPSLCPMCSTGQPHWPLKQLCLLTGSFPGSVNWKVRKERTSWSSTNPKEKKQGIKTHGQTVSLAMNSP